MPKDERVNDVPPQRTVTPYLLTSVLIAILSMWAMSWAPTRWGALSPVVNVFGFAVAPLVWIGLFIAARVDVGKRAHWLWLTFPVIFLEPVGMIFAVMVLTH
jgi:hypothetical protein